MRVRPSSTEYSTTEYKYSAISNLFSVRVWQHLSVGAADGWLTGGFRRIAARPSGEQGSIPTRNRDCRWVRQGVVSRDYFTLETGDSPDCSVCPPSLRLQS